MRDARPDRGPGRRACGGPANPSAAGSHPPYGRRGSPRGLKPSSLGLARHVLLAGPDDHVLLEPEVAHHHGALRHPGDGAVAAVLHEPARAAHGRRAELACGAELTLALAPQLAGLLARGRA